VDATASVEVAFANHEIQMPSSRSTLTDLSAELASTVSLRMPIEMKPGVGTTPILPVDGSRNARVPLYPMSPDAKTKSAFFQYSVL
jgi:hypothetical protein